MKKTLIIIGAILLAVIILAVVIPFFIPMERYKAEISTQVKNATGRDFVIAGPLSLSLFPNVAMTAEQVSFSNAPGAKNAQMASLDKLHISLKLFPLLSGSMVIDGFELNHPVIHLEVDKEGKGNWEFPKSDTPEDVLDEKDTGAAKMLRDLSLGDVRLLDGLVTYSDARTGKSTEVSAMNARVTLPKYDGPLQVDGDLVWNREKIDLKFTTENLKTLMTGGKERISADVKSAPVSFSLDGSAIMGKNLTVGGDVKLDTPSVRKLAAWQGKALDMPGTGLGPLNIQGMLSLADKRYAFHHATIKLDNINATGSLAVTMGGPRPMVTGIMDVKDLDLNPYLPPVDTRKTPLVWSTAPIDLSGLKAADLSFVFKTETLKYRKISIGRSRLDLNLDNGLLKADLKEMALYNGTGKGAIQVNASGGTPVIKADFALSKVDANPVLKDAGDFDRLSGALTTSFNITTSGKNQKELVSALNGSGAMTFKDGTLKGVDVAAIAENIEKVSNGIKSGGAGMLQSLVSGDILGSLKSVAAIFGGKGDVDKTTKFTSLNATWTAKSGTITNNDMMLVGPLVNQRALFKMTGKGDIILPPQELNYEAEIRSFARTDAAGGGIGGRVRLTGNLSDPSPCVVLGSICIGKNTKPGDLLKTKLKDSLLGGASGEEGAPASSPADKLKGLFKGFKP